MDTARTHNVVGKVIQVQTSYLQFPLAAANAVVLLAVETAILGRAPTWLFGLKLAGMGVNIDKLTKEQEKYLASWEMGT